MLPVMRLGQHCYLRTGEHAEEFVCTENVIKFYTIDQPLLILTSPVIGSVIKLVTSGC